MEEGEGKDAIVAQRDARSAFLPFPAAHTLFFFFYNNALVSRLGLGTAIAVPPPSDRRTRTQWRKILIRRKLVTFQAATSFEDLADDKGNPCILAPVRNR